jgi:hypothetical protein
LEQTQGADKVSLFCSTFLFHNRSMIYGFARVPTEAQDLTSQLAQLKGAGCENVYREKLTGTTADRPQLRRLITKLAPGDVVIIPAVDPPVAGYDRPTRHRPRDAEGRGGHPVTR